MEPLPEDQQSVGWVKCTIGTVVLCLVFGATLLLTGPFHVQPQFQYVLVLPSMIAAFLIGVHFQTWKWPAAPLVVAIPFVAMGVLGCSWVWPPHPMSQAPSDVAERGRSCSASAGS